VIGLAAGRCQLTPNIYLR